MNIKILKRSLQGLLAIQFFFWIVFGIIYITKIQADNQNNWIIAILMVLNGFCFAVFAYLARKKTRFIYILLLLFLTVNTILTITDQTGIFDWIILFLNLITVLLSILVIIMPEK